MDLFTEQIRKYTKLSISALILTLVIEQKEQIRVVEHGIRSFKYYFKFLGLTHVEVSQ